MLFCKTAPYRIKDFTIPHFNEMCNEWISSARPFRIVGVSPELGILLSCACTAGAGTWLMTTWHWFEYFLEWDSTELVIWKHIKWGHSPCVSRMPCTYIPATGFYFRVVLKSKIWGFWPSRPWRHHFKPRNGSKWSRRFSKKIRKLNWNSPFLTPFIKICAFIYLLILHLWFT